MLENAETLRSELAALRRRHAELLRVDPPQPIADRDLLRASDASPVRLSALFGAGNELLLIHNMGRKCSYCTLWADAFNGVEAHLANRAAFVLLTPDPPQVARDFAQSRGWKFPICCAGESGLNRELGFEPEPGKVWPGVTALSRTSQGAIEAVARDVFGPGDAYSPVWHLFALLPGGAANWSPRLSYD